MVRTSLANVRAPDSVQAGVAILVQPSLKSHFHFLQIRFPSQALYLTQVDEAPPQTGLAISMAPQRCAAVGRCTVCAKAALDPKSSPIDPPPSAALKTMIPIDILSLVIVLPFQ